MDFYQSVTEALYSRMEDEGTTGQLEMCGAYARSLGEYQELMKEIRDPATAAKLDRMVWKLCDLKAQYFYRMGLQDGVSLTGSDFLTRGLS